MYGTIAKPSDFESYVSLNQLDNLDEPEKSEYCINACNIAGCILVSTIIYGLFFYLVYYVF
uniref:Uncharacterized protein n=1 Tax=viral metagenome TaxID=1070528 RepID=A0A6C0LBA3_9ZZZZ